MNPNIDPTDYNHVDYLVDTLSAFDRVIGIVKGDWVDPQVTAVLMRLRGEYEAQFNELFKDKEVVF